MEKPRDKLFVECPYSYLFRLSDRLLLLSGDCTYLADAEDDQLGVQRVLRASWPFSLQMGVLLSTIDYDVLVMNARGGWLNEVLLLPDPSGLARPNFLEREDFPLLKSGFFSSVLPLGSTTTSLV